MFQLSSGLKNAAAIQLSKPALNSPPEVALSIPHTRSSIQVLKTGDSRSNPFRISTKSSYKDSDRVGSREGDKYYQFNLSKKREIKISVTNNEFLIGPSLDFRLLDSRGDKIKSRKVFGDTTGEIRRDLSKGTYYIKVESNGRSVPYRLKYSNKAP